ncbi:hypothetical protein OsJ_29436 [Oryza sativa Japonica Group]|uniref:Uncharacterized protein n=1 Tax=Oryza sativa subsp. japonica TaxID=39947 RepID=B9G3P7_ORYSJ|nr:hypothetical protein OsJ_29436 [Oryza sativa Japonica Group]
MSSEFAANGGIHGSLTGISIGVGVSSTQKVWRSLQAFGDIAFAYSFSNILIEIQDTNQGAATVGGKGDEERDEAERGDDDGVLHVHAVWVHELHVAGQPPQASFGTWGGISLGETPPVRDWVDPLPPPNPLPRWVLNPHVIRMVLG